MTLADAKTLLRPLDVILTKKDGEYRVVRRGGSEESAYYTDDLWDAYETGKLKQYDPGRRATPTGPRAHGQMRQRATD
jgi:hypothetical protein